MLHTDGYEIQRKFIDIPDTLIDDVKYQAQKARNIFNNASKRNTRAKNDGLRRQCNLKNNKHTKLLIQKIKKHFEQTNLTANEFVILHSISGCSEQLPHCDYEPNLTFATTPDVEVPLGCIIALQDNTKFIVWPKSIRLMALHLELTEQMEPINKQILILNKGDILYFRGDLVHAGAAYDESNYRIHCYIDSNKVPRPVNYTWFANALFLKSK